MMIKMKSILFLLDQNLLRYKIVKKKYKRLPIRLHILSSLKSRSLQFLRMSKNKELGKIFSISKVKDYQKLQVKLV